MIIVTGGLGFVGFNLVKKLNKNNHTDIVIVDDLNNKKKNLKNISQIKFSTIIDYRKSINYLSKLKKKIKCIFHNGAITDTTYWNGKIILEQNYFYSKNLLNFALQKRIDFIYASSASVYSSEVKSSIEDPLNMYAITKYLFDSYVRQLIVKKSLPIKLIGFRYFNVYGPYEFHKLNMSSPIMAFYKQIKQNKVIKIFGSLKNKNYKSYTRDFVHVEDVVNINYLFFKKKPN